MVLLPLPVCQLPQRVSRLTRWARDGDVAQDGDVPQSSYKMTDRYVFRCN